MLTVRIPIEDSRSCEMLLSDGWREGERLETFIKPYEAKDAPEHIVVAGPDKDKIIEIANDAFYPKDKTEWISDAWNRQDRCILVHKRDGVVNGFVITRIEAKTIVIDLIGTRLRHHGIGRTLVAGAQHFTPLVLWGEYDAIQAGTGVTNVAARRFYEALGFTTKHIKRTFHKP